MAHTTVSDLFELAIQVENTCRALYESMEKKFARTPEVASYWHALAREEAGHARWLTDLRAKSTADQSNKKADDETLQQAQHSLEFSTAQAAKNIRTLEDAYEVANELENSEVNAVFEFLITNYAGDPGTVQFLRTQLNTHMTNLQSKLPTAYQTKSARRALKAQ